jgi:hypothetical protein
VSGAAVPRWRIAAGVVVIAGLAFFGMRLVPLYLRNFELQRYVDGITHRVNNNTQSDDVLRTEILEKAAVLDLPVTAENVQIKHTGAGVRIDVRYVIRVDLPMYTVDLHFYPGAGSRD